MEYSHEFGILPRLKISDIEESIWKDIDAILKAEFQILHHQLADDRADFGAIGDIVSSLTYDTVAEHCGVLENRKSYSQQTQKPLPDLLAQAKSRLQQERRTLRGKTRDPEAVKSFNKTLRAYSELLRKYNHTWKAKEQSTHEKRYRKDFFKYIKQEIGEQGSKAQPSKDSKDIVTNRLNDIYGAQNQNTDTSWWFSYDDPTVDFNSGVVRPYEVKNAVSRMRNLSAPGPDGIQPLMVKKLPALQHVLATLFSRLIASASVPSTWQKGTMIFLHKKGDAQEISNYRPITLTSVISKLFHSIINRRLTSYINANGYIDRSVQKGFQRGVNGCQEHSFVLKSLINGIRKQKHSAHFIWVDISNAFGSVPHHVLTEALNSIHVPQWLVTYVATFYSDIQVIGRTKHYDTAPINIKSGVFQGDTLSPTFFLLVFHQFLRHLETERKHGVALGEQKIVSLAFADDLTLIVNNAKSAQRILNTIDEKMKSVGLFIKPAKCFSHSIKSGATDKSRKFKLRGDTFENIESAPFKFLGMYIYHNHQKSNAAKHVEDKLQTILEKIDSLPIRGLYKLQIYERYVTACVRFDLSVHDVSASRLEGLDRMVRKFARKWCAMPPSTHIGMVFHSAGLNITEPSHMYRQGQRWFVIVRE